jgi:hypothetical protein
MGDLVLRVNAFLVHGCKDKYKKYDYIGFSRIKEDLFRHLVISRLAFP